MAKRLLRFWTVTLDEMDAIQQEEVAVSILDRCREALEVLERNRGAAFDVERMEDIVYGRSLPALQVAASEWRNGFQSGVLTVEQHHAWSLLYAVNRERAEKMAYWVSPGAADVH